MGVKTAQPWVIGAPCGVLAVSFGYTIPRAERESAVHELSQAFAAS